MAYSIQRVEAPEKATTKHEFVTRQNKRSLFPSTPPQRILHTRSPCDIHPSTTELPPTVPTWHSCASGASAAFSTYRYVRRTVLRLHLGLTRIQSQTRRSSAFPQQASSSTLSRDTSTPPTLSTGNPPARAP